MQCLRCGWQNKATNEYCEGCGAPELSAAPVITSMDRPARFCGRCSAPAPAVAQAPISPGNTS